MLFLERDSVDLSSAGLDWEMIQIVPEKKTGHYYTLFQFLVKPRLRLIRGVYFDRLQDYCSVKEIDEAVRAQEQWKDS